MTPLRLESFDALDALPASAATLLETAGREALFTSRPWYDSFVAAGLTPDAQPVFFVLSDAAGDALAILPCQRRTGADPSVSSLTSFYSCDFRPVIAPGPRAEAAAFELGRAIARALSAEAAIGFDSLDLNLPIVKSFLAGLSRPGRALLRYDHFGRWHEDLDGRGFADYLAGRDGALREVIRRKGAKLARDGGGFEMIGAGGSAADIERGIVEYEAVYRESWKEPEPFPDFQPVLMRNLAAAGWLRLAICHLDGQPIAAQLWVVVGRTATVLKLAHDRKCDSRSPGTLLTAFAIRILMADDGIAAIDFGRGDDPYKRAWTGNRTPHIGVLSVDIRRRPLLVARHMAGALIRKLRRGA